MKVIRKNISEIDNRERKEIDKLIENNFGLIFHEVEFNRILSESFDTELSYFLAYNSNQLIGICPLHTIKKGLVKTTYSSPAIFEVPYGGWIYSSNEASLSELMNQIKPSFNETLTYWSVPQVDKGDYLQIKNKRRFQTAIIDLKNGEDAIWQNSINSKRRNMIRKALKSEINIKSYGVEGFDLYYPLMIDMHNRAGLKSKPKTYYKNIMDVYFNKGQAIILLAEKDNEIISGVILVGNKNVMHYWQGASKEGVPNMGQGELLQWEAIKCAKGNGSQYYDLCVVEKERLPNIAIFKLGFSKDIKPFYNISIRPLTFRILNRMNKWF